MRLATCLRAMQPAPKRNVTGLIVWSAAFVALTTWPIRHTQPLSEPAASAQVAVPHTAWRPPPAKVAQGAATSCTGPAGPVTRDARLIARNDAAKAAAIRANCLLR
jgi:hypothetical protein